MVEHMTHFQEVAGSSLAGCLAFLSFSSFFLSMPISLSWTFFIGLQAEVHNYRFLEKKRLAVELEDIFNVPQKMH